MTDYNVWRFDTDRWVNDLGASGKGSQSPYHPKRLTYLEARKVLEWFRNTQVSDPSDVQVRELPEGSIAEPGEIVGYNVWVRLGSHAFWTNHDQDVANPRPRTYNYAESVRDLIGMGATIMEIGADLSPQPVFRYVGAIAKAAPTPVVEAPPLPPTPPEPAGAIDFDTYNGFKRLPIYGMRQLQANVDPTRDPYTGLPKEK